MGEEGRKFSLANLVCSCLIIFIQDVEVEDENYIFNRVWVCNKTNQHNRCFWCIRLLFDSQGVAITKNGFKNDISLKIFIRSSKKYIVHTSAFRWNKSLMKLSNSFLVVHNIGSIIQAIDSLNT